MTRPSNGWADRARKIIEDEVDVKPYRPGGGVVCDCSCHKNCHTCGNPFVGNTPHINCADTLSVTGQIYTSTWGGTP